MIKKVEAWCNKHKLLVQKDTIVIGCSGGPDSLALVDIMMRLSDKYELRVVVAHLNHMFRGKEAKADAEFVVAFCHKHGIQCYQKSIDVPAYIAQNKVSPEDGARIVRYGFLRQVAKEIGGAKIAVGHHQDDQAETVLIHLLRGAGSNGLRGMQARNQDIIRPFLAVTREEIEAYCKERQLNPRLDQTNLETEYLRNQIRLELLPELMKKFNPAIQSAICRSADLIGAEHDFISKSIEFVWTQIVKESEHVIKLNRNKFNILHIAQKRQLIRQIIEKKCGNLRGISFSHVEKMIELSEIGMTGTKIELPGQLIFQCNYAQMELKNLLIKKAQGEAREIILNIGETIEIPGLKKVVTMSFVDGVEKIKPAHGAIFDFDKLHLPLTLRFRRAGDVFQPSGMKGHKKLKDFFIDCKIEQEQRDKIPLICDQNEIIWIAGLRQSEVCKVSSQTKKLLKIVVNEKQN